MVELDDIAAGEHCLFRLCSIGVSPPFIGIRHSVLRYASQALGEIWRAECVEVGRAKCTEPTGHDHRAEHTVAEILPRRKLQRRADQWSAAYTSSGRAAWVRARSGPQGAFSRGPSPPGLKAGAPARNPVAMTPAAVNEPPIRP
jgi:hypothetical protein